MPSTPAQNRKNALKSTGPKSDRGKAVSRHNAAKHGLLAKKPPVLLTEDREWFDQTMASLIGKYQPDSPIEHLIGREDCDGLVAAASPLGYRGGGGQHGNIEN